MRHATPIPIVVDTDTASDDAVALLLAAASGLARIEAVTTVAGNVPIDLAVRNALYTLELAGAPNVPVYPGAERPLARALETAQSVHGDDGMGDIGIPDPADRPQQRDAVDALLELAERSDGDTTLVTLGPLTNIAHCIERDAGFLDSFAHVYSMAGSPDLVGNRSDTAEYNVWADPEAAAAVLATASAEQLTWVGWDVSRKDAVLDPEQQALLFALGTELSTFAHQIHGTVNAFATDYGLAGYGLPDPITMAAALDPSLILASERRHVDIAVDDLRRGDMLIAPDSDSADANLTMVRRMDGAGFRGMLLETCANPVMSIDLR